MAQLRNTVELCESLLWFTPRKSLDKCLYEQGDETTITGLTLTLKSLLTVFCLLPQAITVILVNWLGCRWLMATNKLDDFVLNALALEFVLVLPELLYKTMATKRSIHITKTTLVRARSLGEISMSGILGAMLWLLMSMIWVYAYIHYFQTVLPDYHWDVQKECAKLRTFGGDLHEQLFDMSWIKNR